MALSAILGALLVTGLPFQERQFDMAAQPDLCVTDPAAVVRPDAKGVTARYVFQLKSLTPGINSFFDGLDRTRFSEATALQTQNFSIVFIGTRIPARDAEQVRAEAKILCGFAKVSAGKMALFERSDAEDRARQERAREKQARERERREAAVRERAARALAEKMVSPPSGEEVAALLRTPAMLHEFFDDADPGLKLGVLRELKCTPFNNGISWCHIGLPVYQRGEPQYVEFNAGFERDATGTLIAYQDPIIVT